MAETRALLRSGTPQGSLTRPSMTDSETFWYEVSRLPRRQAQVSRSSTGTTSASPT